MDLFTDSEIIIIIIIITMTVLPIYIGVAHMAQMLQILQKYTINKDNIKSIAQGWI